MVSILRAEGVEPVGYRATGDTRTTVGRWKGYVVEYTPYDGVRRPGFRWFDVRLIVERGVLMVAAWGPIKGGDVPPDTCDPHVAARGLVCVLNEPML